MLPIREPFSPRWALSLRDNIAEIVELKYDVGKTAETMRAIMEALNIPEFRIIVPKPPGAGNINYGIWLEFHKPE